MLAGHEHTKEATETYIFRLYPGTDLYASPRAKKRHMGMVDALAIATYGVMKERRDHLPDVGKMVE